MKTTAKIISALSIVAGLGVAILPLSSYAATESKTKVTVTIGETLSIASNAGGAKTASISDLTAADETMVEKLTVTANKSGYKLTVKADTNKDMMHTDGTSKIQALDNDGTLTAGRWGLNATNATASLTSTQYKAVKTTPVDLVTVSTPVAGDVTNIKYGVFPASNQKAGSYSVDLTYTVTAN